MPKVLSIIKYFIKAIFFEMIFNFDKEILNYKKLIERNLDPYSKYIDYDKRFLNLAEKIFKVKGIDLKKIDVNLSETKILILNSEIYDNGGHTEVAMRYIKAFKDQYEIIFLLTGFKSVSAKTAPFKSEKIKNNVDGYIEFDKEMSYDNRVIETYNYIIDNKVTTVNVNIHMYDVVGCAVLGLLKKYTNIKIVFWNHGDHFFALGTKFADKIITRCKNGRAITPYLSDYKNTFSLPFLVEKAIENAYDVKEIDRKKFKVGIPEGAFITLTGCSLSKLGDEYFAFISEMLEKNKNIYHILVSTIRGKDRKKILNLFENNERFILIDFTSEFDWLIKNTDMYVDSFPQGSALTLVDYIKYGKPVLIKINKENPIKSFEEYLYADYEYACKTREEMLKKLIFISSDKEEYVKISKKVRSYYNEYYSFERVKEQYKRLI